MRPEALEERALKLQLMSSRRDLTLQELGESLELVSKIGRSLQVACMRPSERSTSTQRNQVWFSAHNILKA